MNNLPTKFQDFVIPASLADARHITQADHLLSNYICSLKPTDTDHLHYYELCTHTNSKGLTFNVYLHSKFFTSSKQRVVQALRSLDQIAVYKLCRSIGILQVM